MSTKYSIGDFVGVYNSEEMVIIDNQLSFVWSSAKELPMTNYMKLSTYIFVGKTVYSISEISTSQEHCKEKKLSFKNLKVTRYLPRKVVDM